VDTSYLLARFELNKANRVEEIIAVPGGKGVNVAKVALALGAKVTASGFLGGVNGEFIHKGLENRGMISDFVWIQGDSRKTIAIIDQAAGIQTELLERGPFIQQEEQVKIELKVAELAAKSKVIVFSGSVPEGLPEDIYAKLIHIAKDAGALTFLDSSGKSLMRGREGTPFFMKPNLFELEQILGYALTNQNEVVKAAKKMVEQGIRLVVVSMDKEGAVAVTENSAWQFVPPRIQVESAVGCGDSMVAGCAFYFDQLVGEPKDEDIENAMRIGTAAAVSNALSSEVGSIRKDEVERYMEKVEVRKISFA
jgi:tagatose 6-phosphate kinase